MVQFGQNASLAAETAGRYSSSESLQRTFAWKPKKPSDFVVGGAVRTLIENVDPDG